MAHNIMAISLNAKIAHILVEQQSWFLLDEHK